MQKTLFFNFIESYIDEGADIRLAIIECLETLNNKLLLLERENKEEIEPAKPINRRSNNIQ